MANITNRSNSTFDSALEFKDAGLVAATGNAQVDGADKIVTLGDSRWEGKMELDVSAIETASSDETYRIMIQGSNSATMASGIVNLAEITLGHTSGAAMNGAETSTVGHYELPFQNVHDGETQIYARIRFLVAGSVATGINVTAYASKKL